jgi:hypothetical protein
MILLYGKNFWARRPTIDPSIMEWPTSSITISYPVFRSWDVTKANASDDRASEHSTPLSLGHHQKSFYAVIVQIGYDDFDHLQASGFFCFRVAQFQEEVRSHEDRLSEVGRGWLAGSNGCGGGRPERVDWLWREG